ncbi:MAG TPA: ThuA domain-containing protein, partial [Gemmataceae bacterium]|nr:ThuA domain-containing protein [Gemmataceae bacterium]
TGYSRGKLYRTKLVPTSAGYVARNHLLACLNMLAVDCCVSPKGELVVAVHSGAPDWGSGPSGKGKLYKITYRNRQHPQPILVWPAGPREVRVAFDRPLDPALLEGLAKQTTIEYGEYVRAGDRFETLRPGYATVQQQLATPRFRLPILSAGVSADRRTLILTTAPQSRPACYAVTLPGLGRPEKPRSGELPQHSAIDLDYDLNGVEAIWQPRDGGPAETFWLPHLDLSMSRALMAGSTEHERLWRLLTRPGQLTLRTILDLEKMLEPAFQPGSLPEQIRTDREVALHIEATRKFSVKGLSDRTEVLEPGRRPVTGRTFPVREEKRKSLEVEVETGGETLSLSITFSDKSLGGWRPLPLRRFQVPWARPAGSKEEPVVVRIPELEGGSWTRGREVFHSDEAACAKCHVVGGQGGRIGPDLSNLIHRDYVSVLKDIREPSAAINPDHLGYAVELKDGRILTGVLRSDGAGRLILGDNTGKETTLSRREIESLTPSPVSVMPEGLDKTLGPQKLRDLLTFLLTEPLQPAKLEIPGAPAPRKRSEVEAVLKKADRPDKPLRKLRILLAAGPKDHGPGEHDYPLWQRRWFNLLSLAENVRVETVNGWPTQKLLDGADVIVFYSNNPGWSAEKGKQLDAFLQRGGGLVYLHYAVDGHKDVDALAQRIGLAWRGGISRFRHGALELTFPDPKHPITRGFDKVRFVDESYWRLSGDVKKVHVLASGTEEGEARPLLWTHESGKGRVFVSILGHYTWTFDDPLFRVLVLRGIAWSAGEAADRLTDLATVGARLAD